MNDLLSLITRHGYVLIFVIVLGEASGLPLPAALTLIAGGAAVAAHVLNAPLLLVLAVAAMLAGDSLLFVAGRKMGWRLLAFLCRVSVNPETCILRGAESFYKRGRATLLVAKFIPGVNTMAAPLAGSMNMRFGQFFQFDLAGASLYIVTYLAVGFLARDFLRLIFRQFQIAGHFVGTLFLVVVAGYVAYRIWLYRKYSVYRVVPRIEVEDLARKVEAEDVMLVDVRSHGYYDAGALRIKGSFRLEPNNLAAELKNLPRDKDIYLYCT
jgi:membrane protein DedA with SNARE-associated domain